MSSNLFTRRDFSARLLAVLSGVGVAGPAFGSHMFAATRFAGPRPRAGSSDEISRTAEAVHQEIVLKASRQRVYEALTETARFDRVIQLGEARMSRGKKPTEISREVGGAFSLFGGFIVGRNIELVPGARIVQAWREVAWPPGAYSLVKLELTEFAEGAAANTKLVLDHTGFPQGAADHLLIGWKANYWEPLKKYLAQ